MKSSINVRYNVYAPKAERNSATHLNRKLTRADALGHASIKQRCEIQCEALEFSDEHKWLLDLN